MYRWLTKESEEFLRKDYLLPNQTVDERVDIICNTAGKILGDETFAYRFKENIKKGWYSLSSPIWSNFGTERGLPISCFGSSINDCMESILSTVSEVGMMTKYGGGTSGFFGNLRPRGSLIKDNGESHGSVHFMRLFDNLINVVSQGKVRRGNFAAYLPIEHDDIEEFLSIRSDGSQLQDLSFGVTVTNKFMEEMITGDSHKRKIWAKVLETRANIGYPYIIFIDNMNDGMPVEYHELGLKITHSNLCTEIALPDNDEYSFVCDLSSMNILYYDEWKDTDAVELLVFFLDAVMTEFFNKAKNIKYLEKAVKFAEDHRAIGIGWLGWHSYLQSRMIAFESDTAKKLNIEIASQIQSKALKASKEMASLYGEPKLLKGKGRRHMTLQAIAPTKSSAAILGFVSEGVEPEKANYYIKDLAKGKFTFKNRYLEKLLEDKEMNNVEVWDSILRKAGSIQHLLFLSEEEKAVFKTFAEINQQTIVDLASQRQKFIDQAQSINLTFTPETSIKKVNEIIISAWRQGMKSLYYQNSVNSAQEFTRELIECQACSV
jgi:ribonucleoside-diphosphate reductase alpha chain